VQIKEFNYRGSPIMYRTAGNGPVVILLHGFGEEGSVWRHQFSLFPAHRLIVPDLPGSGKTNATGDMSMEGLAEAMEHLLREEAGAEPVTMIGHSMGGYITLAFAEKYPERLNGFGLFHSTAFADSEEKKKARQQGIRVIESVGANAFLEASTANLYAPQNRELHPEWIEEHLATVRNFSGAALVSYYKAMIERPDRTTVLARSKVPVLFVMGRHDAAVPMQDSLKQSHLSQINYIHILDHSGHMGMIEETGHANQILSAFVNSIEKNSRT
jgi:pimeloyl-ACP methyl ester carboxylesterase